MSTRAWVATRPGHVRVADTEVRYRPVPFRTPLVLSSGPIRHLTEAEVTVTVRTRVGAEATGRGSVLLSHPWAYGRRPHEGEDRDAVLRTVVDLVCSAARESGEYADPLALGVRLLDGLGEVLASARDRHGLTPPLPYLAGLVCLSPLDAAVHDAWGRALGGSCYSRYTAEYLGADLSAYLGPAFAGRYPGDYLAGRPATRLPVQHVVGVDEPLTRAEAGTAGGSPACLADWVHRDGVRYLKVKIHGADPRADANRIRDVHRVAAYALAARGGDPGSVRLSLDPDEGCTDPKALLTTLRLLAMTAPAARAALDYAEQPFPRDRAVPSAVLAELAAELPVLLDEGLPDVRDLDRCAAGWSGVVVKTCRGQTQALLAYCWAREHGRYVTVQDLTSVGLALEHSAALAARMGRDVPAFECNSRQYAPDGNAELAARRPELLAVRDGEIDVTASGRDGIC